MRLWTSTRCWQLHPPEPPLRFAANHEEGGRLATTAGRPSFCVDSPAPSLMGSGFSLLFNDVEHFELFIVDQRVDEAGVSRDTDDECSVEGT